jgi:hypothetical protein
LFLNYAQFPKKENDSPFTPNFLPLTPASPPWHRDSVARLKSWV